MTENSIYSEVCEYLTQERKQWYENLLKAARSACEDVQGALGGNCITRIYGRADKQGGRIFKTEAKIAEKIARKRSKGEDCLPHQIGDIIGLTIVVQYPDQIGEVVAALRSRLEHQRISIGHSEHIQKDGYFATHLDLISENIKFPDVGCELQIKTMLHDALAHKMHDLNYKPDGYLDQRLDGLMRTLATSLEAIELQSQTIRDLILEKWTIEADWRKAARLRMFEMLPVWDETPGLFDAQARLCRGFLEAHKEQLSRWEDSRETLDRALADTRTLAQKNLRAGWILLTYLGLITDNPDAKLYATVRIQDWISHVIRQAVNGKNIDYKEVWLAPLALMALAQTEAAVVRSREILERCSSMPSHDVMITKLNLANFLVEREYFRRSKASESEKLKEEILSLIEDCKELEDSDPSAFEDLRGMLLVSFADRADEVTEGIALIQAGKDNAPTDDRELATIFYELHSRLAWRRLLHLEDRQRRLQKFTLGEGR